MGNRAVITTYIEGETLEEFEAGKNNRIGIYLHWNGGRDSVEGFLKYCKIKNFRSPESDCYGWARLVQIITNTINQDGLSVGIDTIDHLDCNNWDNGVYLIKNWEIVNRYYFEREEQNTYHLENYLEAIDESQPKPLTKNELFKEIIKEKE